MDILVKAAEDIPVMLGALSAVADFSSTQPLVNAGCLGDCSTVDGQFVVPVEGQDDIEIPEAEGSTPAGRIAYLVRNGICTCESLDVKAKRDLKKNMPPGTEKCAKHPDLTMEDRQFEALYAKLVPLLKADVLDNLHGA